MILEQLLPVLLKLKHRDYGCDVCDNLDEDREKLFIMSRIKLLVNIALVLFVIYLLILGQAIAQTSLDDVLFTINVIKGVI